MVAVVVRETERLLEEACELAGREESPDCPGRTSAWRGSTWPRPASPAPSPRPSGAWNNNKYHCWLIGSTSLRSPVHCALTIMVHSPWCIIVSALYCE